MHEFTRKHDSGIPSIAFTFDGKEIAAVPGEMIATALLCAGVDAFRLTESGPRAAVCNMGVCFECCVSVDGQPLVRSCLTPVQQGIVVDPGNVR